jgi:hypothetical protein
LTAGQLSEWLLNGADAIPELLSFTSPEMINLPFPGHQQSKFELLNGWMKPEPPFDQRVGCGRARWFLRKNQSERRLAFDVKLLATVRAKMCVLLDGRQQIVTDVSDQGWSAVFVDLKNAPQQFVLELRLQDLAKERSDQCFAVRGRQFHSMQV